VALPELFPILASLKFPLLSRSSASGGSWRATWSRRCRDYSAPRRQVALALLALMIMSVPTSIYAGLSFDSSQGLPAHVCVDARHGAGARAFKDVERLLVIHVIGAAAFAFLT